MNIKSFDDLLSINWKDEYSQRLKSIGKYNVFNLKENDTVFVFSTDKKYPMYVDKIHGSVKDIISLKNTPYLYSSYDGLQIISNSPYVKSRQSPVRFIRPIWPSWVTRKYTSEYEADVKKYRQIINKMALELTIKEDVWEKKVIILIHSG